MPKRPAPQLPGIRLFDLRERHCRWPLGDFRTVPVRFCGCATVGSSPYCSEHTERAFSGHGHRAAKAASPAARV